MGTYEEDRKIRVSSVIKLWVSEEFLKPIKGKSLETVAKEYLDELVERNLLLVDEFGKTGNMKYLKIHDLLRDLCLREAQTERFYHVVGRHSPQGTSRQSRVVIPRITSKKEVIDVMRSTTHARSYISDHKSARPLPNSKLLRILRVDSFEEHKYFPGKMFNLRFLEVYSQVPSSINLMWSLLTLIIPALPNEIVEIWTMPQLRHVYLWKRALHLQDPLSDSIVIMENLQTLKGVKNFKFDEIMVTRIPNIKKLGLIYNPIDSLDDDYCTHNIERLKRLESISCKWFPSGEFWRKLTFPHSIKCLTLGMFNNRMEEILEKVSTLPLLQKLKLSGGYFTTGKWETVEGQFPSLKYLSLQSCGQLQCWLMESSHFPCLEHLDLFWLKDLKEIPGEFGEIPTLKSVVLKYCSESAVESAKRMVEEQKELQGEDQLSFQVTVRLSKKNEELQSLASPNFQITAFEKRDSFTDYLCFDKCLPCY